MVKVEKPEQGRPSSGRSVVTSNTFPTNNQTAVSGSAVAYQGIVIDRNSRLVDYIRYDSTLGREQNITMGKESSLSNLE
jgi:hypothetical protein